MANLPEAVVAVCRCTSTRTQYGIEFRPVKDRVWRALWSFPISEEDASFEGFDETSIEGDIVYDPHYNGCLGCQVKGFTVCGRCKKLSCGTLEGDMFHCPWCGHSGKVTYGQIAFRAGGNF